MTGFAPVANRLGVAWLGFCFSLAVHVTDEALTGFLLIYNPTITALKQRLGFWPMPTFEFREWLTGLVILIMVLLSVSPLMFRNVKWFRPIAYIVVILAGILNAMGHTLATI